MKTKYLFLSISILLFLVQSNYGICSDIDDSSHINDLNIAKVSAIPVAIQEIDNKIIIEKEIKYYAPKSGFVYLVWKAENYPVEKSLSWNDNTKLIDDLLYTPMEVQNDTFKVQLKLPIGTDFQYNFEVTRTKQGTYQDFYDEQSGGEEEITNAVPIIKNANYTKVEIKSKSEFITKGWMILLFLVFIYALLKVIQSKFDFKIYNSSIPERVLFLGFSLAVFYTLARAEIIGVNPFRIVYNPWALSKVFRAAFDDYFFVIGIVTIFLSVLWWIRNISIRKWIYRIFIFLVLFSTLIAYTNITTVIFLGRPFNYQWLYYSGFLGSNEAKTALFENLSLNVLFNLSAFVLSMLILSHILQGTFRFLAARRKMKSALFIIIGLAMGVLSLKAIKAEKSWTKGQSENAITSMLYSMITANTNSSFFTAEIPANIEPFNPRQSTKLETSFLVPKTHSVKNVLFIVLESAGALYFDGYGGKFQLSPNLNKYKGHALMFDQMYAHAPATNLSLTSILGSMYPYLSYMSITQEYPDVDYPTISSVLKNNNYRTSFFSSADLRFQNCKGFLAHRGFDRIEDFSMIQCSEQFQEDNFKELNGIDDICLANRLTSWLDEDVKKNFFSVLWTVQCHYPYFFNNKEEDFGVDDFNFNRYLNCLRHDDELIGEVMHALEERKLDSTTMVIVFGDHGEAFGQHRQYGHGTAIYEENLRVPLYFINPSLFCGEHKSDIAEMKDLATTVLSFLKIEIPEEWQGRDLLSTNSNETFFFAPWSDYLFGYRKDNQKYIFNETQNTVEVYDLSKDPKERFNLFNPGMKEEVSKARDRVAAWVQYQDRFIKQILKNDN